MKLKNYRKSYNKVNVASAQCEQSDTAVQRIPVLRRVIEITDFCSGEAITHKLELFKANQTDCYEVFVDGKL